VKFATPPADGNTMVDEITRLVVAQCRDSVLFLHERHRHPRDARQHRHGEGLVSLLAVAATGVYVVGTHDRPDAVLRRHRVGHGERHLTEELDLGRTDVAGLLDDLEHQVAAVRSALADRPAVPVRRLVCVWLRSGALLGTPTVGGVPLVNPTGAASLLRTAGPLDHSARTALHAHLAERLPAA
jgi:hypothetical protein